MIRYLLFFVLLLSSCGIFTDFRTIEVSLPDEAPPWFIATENQIGKVIYPGESGYIESSTIDWNKDFSIVVEKGSIVPVACYPSGTLKPAGAFLSMDSENGKTLKLEWENGFLADLLLEMIEKNVPIEHINIRRLYEEIKTECNGDPWSINREILEEAIIYNTLSVYKIRQGDQIDIVLPLEGLWISDNPFYPPIVSDPQREWFLEGIYPGMHRFQNPVTKEYLDILIGDGGYEYLLH
ncbi:MAG: hypothetical protein KAH95_17560 [Spirochaetales bacterium]|nr:hypothetical protein [Spirochaetales bacterium]